MAHVKIGVFDSGTGGLSVANAIQAAMSEYEVVFRNDVDNVPYGSRPTDELLRLVEPILQSMVDDGCTVLVIACNTVTTTLIGTLRERFDVPLVGIEPMVKPAAELTKSGVIAVCATPATLQSERYAQLKAQYAAGITVLEPDCSDWARMIEQDTVDEDKIEERIGVALDQGADIIVLACTHYHWIEETIKALAAGRAEVIQPERAIIAQLRRIVKQK